MERIKGRIKRVKRLWRERTARRIRGAFMAAVLVLSSMATAISPVAAYAAEQTVTGTCHIELDDPGSAYRVGREPHSTFFVTMPDGQVLHGVCLDHGDSIPLPRDYSFTGTWNGSSYDIVVNSRYWAATRYDCHPIQQPVWKGPSWTQRVGDFTWMPNGSAQVVKQSACPGITDGNDMYSLAGAEFTFYNGSGAAVGTLTTDESGATGKLTLPIGNYTVKETKVPEGYLAAPDQTVTVSAGKTATVTFADTASYDPMAILVGKYDSERTYNELEGNMPQGSASLAGAEFTVEYYDTLDYEDYDALKESGVESTRSWVVRTDEDGYAHLSSDYLASGDELYVGPTGSVVLPRGTVVVYESKAPEGYNLNTDMVSFQKIQETPTSEVITYNTPQVPESVKRGDLEFSKKADDTADHLAGVLFKVTSVTTGESHVVVTDENGYFSSASSWNAHTSNTNGNDWALDADGVIDSSKLDPTAGVWFGLDSDGSATDADDARGALPYDTYTIEELRCTNNEGYTLASTSATVTRDGVTVDFGTLDDVKPVISTNAYDPADGDGSVLVGNVSIADKVTYSGLTKGAEYTLVTTVVDAETGEAISVDGNPITATKAFTAQDSSGSEVVEMTLPTYELGGRTITVFEELYDGSDSFLVEHKDKDDTDQQLTVIAPEIGTTASDGVDGDKNVVSDDAATVVDAVSYTNLIPRKEYTVTGTLHVKKADDDGSVTEEALTDADGNPVTAEATFTPEASEGTVDVTFTFDALGLDEDTQLVAFESLNLDGYEVAVHADVNDFGQTVTVIHPEIGTTAEDGYDGDKNVVADTETTVVDTVAYTNLIPRKEYTVTGTLHVKKADDGSVTEEALTDADGNPVTAEATFTPEASEGTVDVTFTFDGTAIPDGSEVVAFESLSRGDVELAVHADVNDENQTVTVHAPSVGTTATDGLDGDKQVVADAETLLTDTIAYDGVLSGTDYTMAGILMDKAAGLPVLTGDGHERYTDEDVSAFMGELSSLLGLDAESDGAAIDMEAVNQLLADNADLVNHMVIATKQFTPEDMAGSLDMDFCFDSNDVIDRLSGETKDLVVFEVLFKGSLDGTTETELAVVTSETDLENAEQTVTLIPSVIGTTATDKSDGDHELMAGKDAVITDTVTYEDLIPGKEYTLKATLYDKATGEPLSVADKHVTAEVRFTPNSPDGSLDIDLGPFDASELDGHELVVFEELYKQSEVDGEVTDVLVAEHKDLNDEGQTVTVTSAPNGGTYGKTGGSNAAIALAILAALALAGGLGAYGLKARRVAKAESEVDATIAKPGRRF